MKDVVNLRAALEETRANTLRLLAEVADVDFACQAHPDFSPVGWHFGHIGVTEGYWILQQCQGTASLSTAYDQFFTPTGNPKQNRIHLPARAEILAYLHHVRDRVLDVLEQADFNAGHPLLKDAGIFNMLLQHEEQHTETIRLILQMLATRRSLGFRVQGSEAKNPQSAIRNPQSMSCIPAGTFLMGSDCVAETLDNERPQHTVAVAAFLIDRCPVSNGEFLQFVTSGGYHDPSWWTPAGWQWRTHHHIEHPLYWRAQPEGEWAEITLEGVRPLDFQQPAMCVSWYEADAYARFVGKRLPTEAEWEKAAVSGQLAMIGSVWEWTMTWFHPYPGFVAHPYDGYSVPYFDDHHKVLKGGSWATGRHVRRPTFRNWYHPWVREIFAGFRCATDG